MISDLEVARLCDDIYDMVPSMWDHFNDGTDSLGICWGIKTVDGFDVVVFRGSTTTLDWIRDLHAWEDPHDLHFGLGPIHPGFLVGMMGTWKRIKAILKNPPIFAGHSLGAARADIAAGLSILEKIYPARTVVLGEPRPGFKQLSDLLAPYPRVSYRNRDILGRIDLVTTVPIVSPPEEYVHPSKLDDLIVVPDLLDKWGAFRLHHSWLYVKGLEDVGAGLIPTLESAESGFIKGIENWFKSLI